MKKTLCFIKRFKQRILFLSSFALIFYIASCSPMPSNDTGYTIAIDPTWFPLDLPSKEPYVLAFTKELMQKISEKKGVKLSRVIVSWDNILEGLNEKDYQGMFSLMEPYLFNLQKYDFSDVYLQTGPVVVMRETATKSEIDKLYEKEIAIFSETEEQTLINLYPDALPRLYDSVPKALVDVAIGSLDGALIEVLEAVGYVADIYKGQLKIATKPLTQAGIKLVALKDQNKHLIKLFNEGLHDLIKDGEYDKLAKKWQLKN